ncbi:RnfABCDGE type electron transport complex subunit D [Pseudogemmobacter sonorensis]|uniref:RnfABCDGE type electron transport complex subunit D n=1 Tax=Pseudogemmobacter sonorensis TaxID=2989681 RepID=UPI0036C073C1
MRFSPGSGPFRKAFLRSGPLRDDVPALLGLLPPVAVLAGQDPWLGPRLLLCLGVVCGWHLLFHRLRGQASALHALTSAVLIALLVPQGAPHWQIVLGASFGVVLGELIFGGRGRNFVQPVVLALAFLAFSFADQPWREGVAIPALLALPGAVLLVLAGQARLSVLAGALAGFFGMVWLAGLSGLPDPAGAGALLIALAWLVADPVVSGRTRGGRLAYGLVAGGLAALFSTAGPLFGALVFAALLAQIFAPLIDHVVLSLHVRRAMRRERRLRHG